jgi:hypothetical protein
MVSGGVQGLHDRARAGLVRYQQFRAAPMLLHTHKVSVSDKLRVSSLGQELLTRIGSLGRFFGSITN